MIRRAFWLGLGAVLGIAGYRRLAGMTAVRAVRAAGAGTASFVRDVRAGMAEYLDGSGE
jgi:hypothetical protein